MFLIIFSIIMVVLLFLGLGLKREIDHKRSSEYRKTYIYTFKLNKLQLLAPLGFLLLLFGIIGKVGAVEEGVLYDPLNNGIQSEVLGEGYHLKAPYAKLYRLSKDQQSLSYDYDEDGVGDAFSVQTANGEFALYAVEIKYRIANTSIAFREFKGMPTQEQLRQYIQYAIKSIATGYDRTDYEGLEGQVENGFTIYEILGNKFEISRGLSEDLLASKFEEFGLELISLNFIDIDAGSEIENAIELQGTSAKQKQININLRDAAEIAKETAEIEAQGLAAADIARAEGDKQSAILEAEAQQEAQILIASGEAEAIRLITEAKRELMEKLGFTPEQYKSYILVSNWDGVLPTTMLDENIDILFNTSSE